MESESLWSVSQVVPEQHEGLNHAQRCLGEKRMLAETVDSAWRDLRSLEPLIVAQAKLWFEAGNVGLITCQEACEYLDLQYPLVRARALAGQGLPRRKRNTYVTANAVD